MTSSRPAARPLTGHGLSGETRRRRQTPRITKESISRGSEVAIDGEDVHPDQIRDDREQHEEALRRRRQRSGARRGRRSNMAIPLPGSAATGPAPKRAGQALGKSADLFAAAGWSRGRGRRGPAPRHGAGAWDRCSRRAVPTVRRRAGSDRAAGGLPQWAASCRPTIRRRRGGRSRCRSRMQRPTPAGAGKGRLITEERVETVATVNGKAESLRPEPNPEGRLRRPRPAPAPACASVGRRPTGMEAEQDPSEEERRREGIAHDASDLRERPRSEDAEAGPNQCQEPASCEQAGDEIEDRVRQALYKGDAVGDGASREVPGREEKGMSRTGL